jgi:hypothetical protein
MPSVWNRLALAYVPLSKRTRQVQPRPASVAPAQFGTEEKTTTQTKSFRFFCAHSASLVPFLLPLTPWPLSSSFPMDSLMARIKSPLPPLSLRPYLRWPRSRNRPRWALPPLPARVPAPIWFAPSVEKLWFHFRLLQRSFVVVLQVNDVPWKT